jgi:DNA polymerase I-like protein with 3'-5' exonuclease and polymerase domains
MLRLPDNILIFDCETTGLWPWPTALRKKQGIAPDRPFLFQFGNMDGDAVSFRAKVNPYTRQVSYYKIQDELRWFRKVVRNPDMQVVCHSARFEHAMTIQHDIRAKWNCKIHDTRIMARLANPTNEPTYGLKPLAKKYLDVDDEDLHALKAELQRARRSAKAKGWTIATSQTHGHHPAEADYWLPELKDFVNTYGIMDVVPRTLGMFLFYHKLFDRNKKFGGKLWSVYKWELRTMRTAMAMERYGMTYLSDAGKGLRKIYLNYMKEHRRAIDRMGYKGLNLQSPKQMQELFIDGLGYETTAFTKGGKREDPKPKIDAEQLMAWARGSAAGADVDGDADDGCKLSRHCLEWKAGKKVIEYIESYDFFKCRRPDGSTLLHPAWDSAGARTGRFSCHDPNTQQIASAETSRRHSHIRARQRECFGPRPGYVWYMPDYSQIEVWAFAFEANEETMKASLLSGSDFHLSTANSAWGSRKDFCTCGRWKEVLQEMRRNKKFILVWDDEKQHHKKGCLIKWWRQRAKMILFSRLYGGGVGKIAFLIRCSKKQARKFIEEFNENLPGVSMYMERVIQQVRDTGTLTNLFGREYPIDRDLAYKAVNYQIQGSCAEIMKRAIVRVNSHLIEEYPGEWNWVQDDDGDWFEDYDGSHVCGTVHDEMINEIKLEDHSKQLMREIISLMQVDSKIIPNLPVPLPVGMKWTTTNWSEAKEISLH